MKVLKEFYFGYDLDNIIKVKDYLMSKYFFGVDFRSVVGMGEDVMNYLEIYNVNLVDDVEFNKLVMNCDGEGNFEE